MTYRDLLAILQGLHSDQLGQLVQIADPPSDCRPVELMPAIAFGSVQDLEFEGARSAVDNRYNVDELVLLIDHNPFAADGALAYELKQEGPEGKPLMRHVPIYGPDGPTPSTSQTPGACTRGAAAARTSGARSGTPSGWRTASGSRS